MIYSISGYRQVYKYIGKDNEYFTNGKEYGLVDVGNYFHDMNLFGAYMQWDEYDGFDDDQCVFIPKSSFSNCFYGDFPFDSETKPSRGERLYKKKKFRNRYRDILLAKTSKDFVEFMESTNELHKVRLHCTCSYCQNGLVAKHVRKELEMKDRLLEYYSESE